MKKVTKVFLLIALNLFGLSVACFVGAAVLGDAPVQIIKQLAANGSLTLGEGFSSDFDQAYDMQNFSLLKEVEAEQINKLRVNVGSGAVVLKETTGEACKVWIDEESLAEELQVFVKENCMTLQDTTYNEELSMELGFWKDFFIDRLEDNMIKVIVEMPQKEYQELTCNIQVGLVKLYDLEVKNLNIDVAMGAAYGEGMQTAETVILNADMGMIDFKKIFAGKCNINVEMGEIMIHWLEADKLLADVEMGDLTFERVHAASIEGDCEMGDMSLKLAGKEEDYFIDSNAEMGDINIEGERKRRYSDALNEVELDCEMGDITISFLNEELTQ